MKTRETNKTEFSSSGTGPSPALLNSREKALAPNVQGKEEMFMKKLTHAWVILAVSLTPALLSSCGGAKKSSTTDDTSQTDGNSGSTGTASNNNNSNNNGGSGNTPLNFATATIQGNEGANSMWTSPNITNTDSKMVVTIKGLQGGGVGVPGYSGWTFTYQCLQFDVSVNGRTETTNRIRAQGAPNPGFCDGFGSSDLSTSSTFDFSDQINVSGENHIVVSAARTDLQCQWLYSGFQFWPYNQTCPMRTLYSTHTVRLNVCVQRNGDRACSQ